MTTSPVRSFVDDQLDEIRTETVIATRSLPAVLGLPATTPLVNSGLRGALTICEGRWRIEREVRQ